MDCWKCGAPVAETEGKIGFRALCEQCGAYLHCCVNCKHYKPGMANDCEVPDTDPIADREAGNFCEDFSVLGRHKGKGASPDDVARRLFGD